LISDDYDQASSISDTATITGNHGLRPSLISVLI